MMESSEQKRINETIKDEKVERGATFVCVLDCSHMLE
jgi:hypothetical protein